MPFPDPTGYAPAQITNGIQSAQPPQYVLDAMGGSYDQSRYYWNPDTFSLVDRYTGGSYSYDRADPANGTDVVTNLSEYNSTGQPQLSYGPGQTPYFGFGDSAQGYNGGDAPNSGMFVSADPSAINDYQSHRQDVINQGVAQVAAIPLAAGLAGYFGAGAGGAAPSTGGATTYPLAGAGGPISAAPVAGAAPSLAGAIPGVGPALAASGGAAASQIPSWIGNYLIPGLNAGLGYVAADQASDAQSDSLAAALAENARQYDQTRADSMPWMQAGQNALTQLQDPNAFTASPDYNFRRGEGTRGIENTFAARGMGQSGNALRALTEFNSGLASGEFGDWYNRRLNLAGLGSSATQNVNNVGQASSARAGNYLTGMGDARASGVLGKYASVTNGLNDSIYNALYRRRG